MASTPSRVSTLTAAVQPVDNAAALSAAAAVYAKGRPQRAETDRNTIAQDWQVEAYRHVNICGEARYAAVLFSAIAGRAEIGVSEPQVLNGKAKWVKSGPEVDTLAELAPTVRERSRLIRDYMKHYTVAGECYLIARERQSTDFGYTIPPDNPMTGKPYDTWDEYLDIQMQHRIETDLFEVDAGDDEVSGNPNKDNPIWEIVAVTELQKFGTRWKVRHDNGAFIDLSENDPVIRMWNPDPENRREAWSPFKSAIPVLREIEWLTAHIFTQVRSRLMSAGVWFLPKNLTFPPPPPDAVEGGAETIAMLNEAQQLMLSLAASATRGLEADEVSFPTVMMAEPEALASIDQDKLVKFWSDIDDKAMVLRNDALGRLADTMDMPSGKTRDKSTTSAGSSQSGGSGQNHWGKWAEQEETISEHVEPALDDFVATLTDAFLRPAVPETTLVLAYDTASLRLRQDRSKQSVELYDRGVLKGEVMLRENGFDPDTDMMDDAERRLFLLMKIAGGSATPEQVNEALKQLSVILPVNFDSQNGVSGNDGAAPGMPGRSEPRSLDDHPTQGPPTEQHDHSDAPFSALAASCEGLILRALEKQGNRVLNDGKRGKDRDRSTPLEQAHLVAALDRTISSTEFDFSLAPTVLGQETGVLVPQMATYCARLYNTKTKYSRADMLVHVKGL